MESYSIRTGCLKFNQTFTYLILDRKKGLRYPPDMSNKENIPNHTAENPDNTSSRSDNRGLRIGINILMVVVLGVLAVLVWQRVITGQAQGMLPFLNDETPSMETISDPILDDIPDNISLAPYHSEQESGRGGIVRMEDFVTDIPERPVTEVISYTVNKGDTLFEIADKYGLRPETILFGNYDILKDNPHILAPGMVLNILPVDGAYYEWKDGDQIEAVANYYRTVSDDIVAYSGNNFDLTALDENNHGISPGTMLVIPGGTRPIKDWGPPAITRQNPASARYYGSGHCGQIYSGAVGTGTFVWPTTYRGISGYPYSGIHPAIDIGGQTGNAIYAVDSGVVVYAGWSNYGYGNLIVIDHGNGFQSAYAHLSVVGVSCGQSVFQGGQIGSMGSTGNSSGPHLHFELILNGAKPNPLDYISQ